MSTAPGRAPMLPPPSTRARRPWFVAVAVAVLVLAALLGFNPFEQPPQHDQASRGTVTHREGGLVFEAPVAWQFKAESDPFPGAGG